MSKILIVDDSAYARRVHRRILEEGGHSVVEAASGLAALEAFTLATPDAVLLDLSMEDLGGLEVLQQIRQIKPDAAVIVVSADVQRSTTNAVRAAGAATFVAKPVQPEQLLAVVAQVLQGAT